MIRRILAALLVALLPIAAQAADNALIVTPGVGVTMRTIDVGALVQAGTSIPVGTNGAVAWGTAGTANANVMTVQGIASMTPFLVTLSGTNNINTVSTLTTITNPVAATQSGTWNITNISGTVSLPTGASTAAKQPALGTAGAASADVISVQGIASMTPFLTNPGTATSWGLNTLGSTTSGQVGQLALGAVTTASPTYTTAQTNALSLDTAGGLRVSIIAGGGSGGTASSFGASFPATGTAIGFTDGTNMVAGRVTTYGTAPTGFNALATNSFITNVNANNQATMANSSPVVLASNQAVGDPCTFQTKTNVPISTASGTTQLVAAVSAKKIYVCSVLVVAPSAVSVSLSEGSSGTCGTSAQAAVIGVATNGTAANGVALAANGGFSYGGGDGTVAQTATANNTLCLFQSGTAQLAGNLSYVQQ